MQEKVRTVSEDLNFTQSMGLISLSITPRKLELREMVNNALSKPPIHVPISRLPMSPIKTPNRAFQDESSEVSLANVKTFARNTNTEAKENWNDMSFCPGEGDYEEEEISEGQCHYKTDRKKRSSSQITLKKPSGMGKRNGKRQSQVNQRNNFEFLNQNHISLQNNSKKQSRGGSTIKSVLEDSLNKFSNSETLSNAFENSVFTTAKKKDKKLKIFKNKDHYKRNKNKISTNPTNYTIKEPTRVLYSELDEAERIMKLSS